MKYRFIQKRNLTMAEKAFVWQLINQSMSRIGFNVQNKDKNLYLENLSARLNQDQTCFYLIYYCERLVGYIELCKATENKLFISEVEFVDAFKATKLIFYFIKFILQNAELKEFNLARFTINKHNKISIKTFTHLGAKVVEEKENLCVYELSRIDAEKFINKFNFE